MTPEHLHVRRLLHQLASRIDRTLRGSEPDYETLIRQCQNIAALAQAELDRVGEGVGAR